MTSVQRLEPARAYAPIAMSAESTVVAEFFPDEATPVLSALMAIGA